MLKLTDVHTFYGPIEALKGINIDIKQGEIVCLIGSNGAGKSTTLRNSKIGTGTLSTKFNETSLSVWN